MNTHAVKLIDHSRNVLATARVREEKDYYGGTIDLCCTPLDVRALFDEFEEVVNGQMFSCLDESEEKIAAAAVKAVFENGQETYIEDLQVYPSTKMVSFRVRQASAAAG